LRRAIGAADLHLLSVQQFALAIKRLAADGRPHEQARPSAADPQLGYAHGQK
jgi:hypothetical protein